MYWPCTLLDQRTCTGLVLHEIRENVLALYSMRSENMYWPCTLLDQRTCIGLLLYEIREHDWPCTLWDQRTCIGPVLYEIREYVLALYSLRSENMYWPSTL